MEPIRPVGRAHEGPAPVPAIRRLTPAEREEAARERERRRRARARAAGARPTAGDEPPAGGGALDLRA